jgi:hypothetical protein
VTDPFGLDTATTSFPPVTSPPSLSMPTFTCYLCGHSQPLASDASDIEKVILAHKATCSARHGRKGSRLTEWVYAALIVFGLLLGIVVGATLYPHG